MADRLEDLLRACTVRVTGGPMPGAGFFVAPGRVLTCVHVIGDSADLRVAWDRDGLPPAEVAVTGRVAVLVGGGRPIPALDQDYPDVAVLEVRGLDGHPCVRIDPDWPAAEDSFQIFGYPSEGGAVLLTPARLTYRGPHGTAPAVFLDLASDTVKPGMSGAALLNLRTGGVCGVVVASKDPARPDGALAIGWPSVTADLAAVLAANRGFHERDRRWESLLRLVTGPQPATGPAPGGAAIPAVRPTAGTEVLIDATLAGGGLLESAVWVAGSLLCRQRAALPPQVAAVWGALRLPGLVAGERMADAGRRLAGALLDEAGQRLLAGLVSRVRPGDSVEVVLAADGAALSLPVELIRLADGAGGEAGPLGLLPAVSVSRRLARPDRDLGNQPGGGAAVRVVPVAGPLKVLVAVAAPDETKTPNAPLDAEAEMGAVLDAVTGMAGHRDAQVRILEVASLPAIRSALAADAYHVLHLSAHGSPDAVELEDEDGAPVTVTPLALMQALRHAGRLVPLIVLSSCSGGASGSQAMAGALVAQGADRVIAMLAPVTDGYATGLARHLYRELTARPQLTAGLALARARYLAEEDRSAAADSRLAAPEYGVPVLLAAGGDAPLVDPAVPGVPLTVMTTPPGGRLVRELPMGALIGRRAQLRATMGILRRDEPAIRLFGAASGVQLTGIGGIGKTAVAGRVISRLRDDGWLIAVHEGRWNPTALITATALAIGDALPGIGDPARAAVLRGTLGRLTDSGGDDGPKLAAVAGLLASQRLLLVFDDFEQNLTPGGEAFADPATEDVIGILADAADPGALLVTCRYPLPGPDRFLVQVPVPPLSGAELRRMFLRLPALADLDAEDRRLLTRTIGGHPRLIEFTDALLRGGHASLRHVQAKLRALARDQGINLGADLSLATALDQAMLLGSADILLTELLSLLTPRQSAVLTQVTVSRAPMTLDDLLFTLTRDTAYPPPDPAGLRGDAERLTDLTLLTASGEGIVMHPWTADLITRNARSDLAAQHERALAMRYRRFEQQRGTYDDLIDIPSHLAALHRYDDITDLADQAMQALPGTLATVAYLAEIRPLIPAEERAWIIVAGLEVQALLRAGDLPAATRQLFSIHKQVQARSAADPANTQWQRDLSVSHNNLGDIATAAGDLAAARASYQASLDIATRLATADPANTGWQRDLEIAQRRIDNLPGEPK